AQDSVNFARLLEKVANVNSELRVRFSTSHPKDMTDEVLEVMSKYENICDYIHLPVQSGSSKVLKEMNRGYTRDWYLDRIRAIRRFLPQCGISTDIMTGFCNESDEDHMETLSLMEAVRFDFSYMFAYSERPKTLAERKLEDNVPESVKKQRLAEVISLQSKHSLLSNQKAIGKSYKVLIEGTSKRSEKHLYGRNSQNVVIVFPHEGRKKGEYVNVIAEDCTAATLIGRIIKKIDL
ncbi:MAG: radical SAM protein, partial [Flavobacteriales bacterium]|nr:radical SAM protein [Flavobacteriales bacterium]